MIFFLVTGSFSPSNILSGPIFQLGDFRHCLKDLREQYCLLEIHLSSGSKNSSFWSNIEVRESNQDYQNIIKKITMT